jgi:hypothetical protein
LTLLFILHFAQALQIGPQTSHREEWAMSPKNSRGSTIQPSSPTRRSPAKNITSPVTVSQKAIELSILGILRQHAAMKGVTNSEVLKKCGMATKRSLAVLFKRKEASTEDIKALFYLLWRKGLVFFEPPNRGQRVGRVWDMQSAQECFSLARTSKASPNGYNERTEANRQALKAAYDKFVPEHLGGFVPIFKVRRELGWPSQAFDSLLQELNERQEPVVELHAADPSDLSDDERRDSLVKGSRLLVRMRWRE